MSANQPSYSISVVERDTGISRDTLRVWERRYGYPQPERNDKGERIYPEMQLRYLQRIRRLLDQGMRPGKIFAMSEQEINQLEQSLHSPEVNLESAGIVGDLLERLLTGQQAELIDELNAAYKYYGMEAFILRVVVPLLQAVGNEWAMGQLKIYHEHILTQSLIRLMSVEIDKLQITAKKPLVMLTTLPGEQHAMGLYMMAGMLSHHGLSAIQAGVEMPMDQINDAATALQVDIVGLTFSSAYQYSSIRSHLTELRALLPEDIEIWAGGEGVRRLRKLPHGIQKFTDLEQLPF